MTDPWWVAIAAEYAVAGGLLVAPRLWPVLKTALIPWRWDWARRRVSWS